MKIRTGFVSNSSSSSFCIYGWVIDLKKFFNEDSNKIKEYISKIDPTYQFKNTWRNFDEYNINAQINSLKDLMNCRNMGTTPINDYNGDDFYIGCLIGNCDPDDIKKNAMEVGEMFNMDISDASYYEEAGYDG